MVVEILQLVHEVSSFPKVLYKRGCLKNISKFTDNHRKQSSGCVPSDDGLKNFAKFTDKQLSRRIELQAENVKLSEAAKGDAL